MPGPEIGLPISILVGALLLDLVFGEYPSWVHPVVWMGWLIALGQRIAPTRGPKRQLLAGALLALLVPSVFAAGGFFLLQAASSVPWLYILLAVLLLKSTLALRSLGQAARVVRRALSEERLEDARFGLRSLCSRDASVLEEEDLVGATIESLAENISDSFVAPLFYYVLFGVPGALFYRAVNTLDAMIGYRETHEYLGKASARLDDLLNLVPARLTALLLLLAGFLSGKDSRRGWAIYRRDRHRTASPNAGRPMAAMAGLLGVTLSKEGDYRLGDPVEALEVSQIDQAWRVICLAAVLATASLASTVGLVHGWGFLP